MYTEEQLFKAVRYALEAQKFHDYQEVGNLLIGAEDKDAAIEEALNYLCNIDEPTFGAFAMIDREEVINHVKS
jgi:hypothetical protein